MAEPGKYKKVIVSAFPDYKFSWEIYTELILDKLKDDPIWLDLGAGTNIIIKEQPGARFALGIDQEMPDDVFTDDHAAYCVADICRLPLKNDSFDFITSRFTFEHLADPETALIEAERVLRPGGIFIVQTTNCRNPLVLMARFIPYFIKKPLYRKLFGEPPSGIFKTHYKINTPRRLFRVVNGLRPKKLYLIEDILYGSKFLFYGSFLMYRLLRFFGLESFYGNMIAVYEKGES